jgi:hypothetical protein
LTSPDSSNGRSSFQIVGTAADTVTSYSSMMRPTVCGELSEPWNTSSAPVKGAAYGIPHPFAWNRGTTGKTRSCCVIPTLSAMQNAIEWSHCPRCEYMTPFGMPVVPEV